MLHDIMTVFDNSREAPGLLPPQPALHVSSHLSKGRPAISKPKANCWDHRLSIESGARHRSTLKATAATSNLSSMISLGTARPTPQYYPWESIVIREIDVRQDKKLNAESTISMLCAKGDSGYDLATVLNYGAAAGSPQLLKYVTEHVELFHNPGYSDWETCLTCSTTSALEIVLRMLCNRGDWIFAEEHTYPGFMEAAKPLGIYIQEVKMDDEGLMPDDLDSQIRAWDPARGPRPSVLYTIPSGQNPTGATQSIERRRAIYELAKQHDLLIIEDDPYYFLQLGEKADTANTGTHATLSEYLNRLPPSYLSLDSDGLVLRLDTTSKILAPGLRCGWLTACSQFVTQFLSHSEFSSGPPSGPSQLMLYKLLDETWDHEGLIMWLNDLSKKYRRRRDIMIEACERHLPSEICSWRIPTVGMFVWIAIDWREHVAVGSLDTVYKSPASCVGVEDRIYLNARKNGVQVSKGGWFATSEAPLQEVHFRLTFAAAPEAALDQAVQCFGAAVRTEFMLMATK